MASDTPWRYKAFISYSHAADGNLAPALQHALQVFTKPWYALRACRIFRDKTTLSVTSELWPGIERALLRSEYFVLLASPEAARSPWVAREVERWCEVRPVRNLLIVCTDGTITWDPDVGDFDWARTSALPPILARKFSEQPLYLDLRWIRTIEQLSRRHPQFLEAIADLSCSLRGLSKDELVGLEVREHRRTRRIVQAVMVVLLSLATAATVAFLQEAEALRVAEARRVQARGVAEMIVFELEESLEGIPEAAEARRMLGARAQGLLAALGGETPDFRVQRALLVQYSREAEDAIARGELERAQEALLRSLAAARGLVAGDPMSSAFRRDVSVCLNKLADLSLLREEFDVARDYLDEDIALVRELLARNPESMRYRNDLAVSLEKAGQLCLARGDLEGARRFLDEDLALMRELVANYPTNHALSHGLVVAMIQQGEVLIRLGELDTAREILEVALERHRRHDSARPDDARIVREISVILLKLGDIALERGSSSAEAVAKFAETLALRRRLLDRSRDDPAAMRDVAVALGRLGSAWVEQDDLAAVKYFEEAVALDERLLERDPTDAVARRDLGVNLHDLAACQIRLERLPDARRAMARSVELLRASAAAAGPAGEPRLELLLALRRAGLVELQLGSGAAAAELHGEACDLGTAIPDAALTDERGASLALDLRDIALAHHELASGSPELARRCGSEALRRLVAVRERNAEARADADLMLAENELRGAFGAPAGAAQPR